MPTNQRDGAHMARTGRPGRPKEVEKKTTLSIDNNLSGWLEFMGRNYGRGASEYLCHLAKLDRDRVLAEGGAEAERYRAFCGAVGYESELDSLSK